MLRRSKHSTTEVVAPKEEAEEEEYLGVFSPSVSTTHLLRKVVEIFGSLGIPPPPLPYCSRCTYYDKYSAV
jgi:hypothetical protein